MKIKKVAAFVMALTMSFTFSACDSSSGDKNLLPVETGSSLSVSDNKNSAESKNKITVYYDEFKLSDMDLTGTIPIAATEDKIYYSRAAEYVENPETSGYILNISDGSVVSDNYDDIKAADIIFRNSEKIIYSVCSETGTELVSVNLSDGDRKTQQINNYMYSGTDAAGNIYIYGKGQLSVYNSSLENIKETDIAGQVDKSKYVYDMCVAADGSVYFSISQKSVCHSIFTLDDTGKLKDITGEMTDLEDNVNGMFIDKAGNLVLSTGYGTVQTDVIDPVSGNTVYRYENYGINNLIGPSENYDMVYLKADGIYGYNYKDDTEEMMVSEDVMPQLYSAYNSSYYSENQLYLTLNETGHALIYEIDSNTGETLKSESDNCISACTTSDGTVYYLTSSYSLEGSSDGYTYETTVSSVYRLEKDGSNTLIFTLPQYEYEITPGEMTIDNDGNIYISYCDDQRVQCIMVYDISGNLKANIYSPESESYGMSVFRNEKSEIFAFFGGDKSAVYKINSGDYSLNKVTDTEKYTSYYFYNGNSGYDFFYSDTVGIYGYKSEENIKENIVLWADVESEAVNNYNNKMIILSPSEILFPNGVKIVKADEDRLNELNSREILTLAVSGIYEIKPFVVKFNRENEKCRILLKDYSQYGTSYEYNGFGADSETLSKDILNNDIPDIIMLDNMDLSSYIVKGIFADLKEFADKDAEFDINDIYPSVIEAFTYKDCLYTIPASAGRKALCSVNNHENWNYDEFLNIKSEEKAVFEYSGSFYGNLINTVLLSYINEYVDMENKKCDFENEKFISLLEYIKENGTPDDDETGWETENGRDYILKSVAMNNFEEFFYEISENEWQPYTPYVLGYPSEGGGKSYIYPDYSFGISAKSEYKDSAWSFIKFILEQDFRNNNCLSSTRISVSENDLKERIDIYEKYQNTSIDNEIIQKYNDFLNMPLFSDYIYSNIQRIIRSETELYFSGETNAEETAKSIQSKVKLYLNEIS